MLNRLSGDRRGSVAVEFALIAPLMVLFYLGMAELTQAMMANRGQSHVASAIGDLVAQTAQTTAVEMDDIFTVGAEIIAPFPTSGLSMRVTAVTADASGKPMIQWCRSKGAALPKLTGTYVGLPAGQLSAGESVVISETKYTYQPQFGQVLQTAMTFGKRAVNLPRKPGPVLCPTC